jgi:phosphoribosylformylglycinamidine synthase subunit PurS
VKDYVAQVRITPRRGLLDPEGNAIEHALQSLAFEGVSDVRAGRLITLRLASISQAEARARVEEMCRRLLANPVTEDYVVELGEGS